MANAPLLLATPLGRTTLSNAISSSSLSDTIVLATNSITVGPYTTVTASAPQWGVCIDGELMDLIANPGSSTTWQVVRGSHGTPCTAHGAGALVWAGPVNNLPSPPAFNTPVNMGRRLAYEAVSFAQVAANTPVGNNTTMVAGTLYFIDLLLPAGFVATGVKVLIGTTGGTDHWTSFLLDMAGNVLSTSLTSAGVVGTANTIQNLPFANTIYVPAGHYLLGLQSNGTTATFQSVKAFGAAAIGDYLNVLTGSFTGTYLTAPAITTIPTTFTANVGPLALLY